jgi:hypothetical protein
VIPVHVHVNVHVHRHGIPHLRHLHLRHGGPARVGGVEETVVHGAEGRESRGREQRPGRAEHVRSLLALLPLGTTVLEPHLERYINNNRVIA